MKNGMQPDRVYFLIMHYKVGLYFGCRETPSSYWSTEDLEKSVSSQYYIYLIIDYTEY